MVKKSPLYETQVQAAAKFVDYAGFSLPVHFGSQLAEHQAVRTSAGMFDVSHLSIIDLQGDETTSWLRRMLTNDVGKLTDGMALYTCMCRECGGVIDHLIVYRLSSDRYRLVINPLNREKDMKWLEGHRPAGVQMHEVDGTAMLAVQGPDAVRLAEAALAEVGQVHDLISMGRYTAVESGDWLIARTGYTGEDGVEIALPESKAVDLWQALSAQGVHAAGLGARDSLRVEAGMCQYGEDLDEDHTPVESGIPSTVDILDPDREFIGKEVLEDHKLFGGRYMQVGIILDTRGRLQKGQSVELVGRSIGTITSGTFSPTREVSVALARVEKRFTGSCDISIRNRLLPAHIASVPFVPHGQARD
ncbi:MAG: glycine cleavage system aminomethyltransferase GcvT [Granulosicoccus sp.]